MDLMYTQNGIDAGIITRHRFDCDIGKQNDFQVELDVSGNQHYTELINEYIYLDGTEYGGIVTERKISGNKLTLKGKTFRGMLNNKIIIVKQGYDYYIATGELKEAINKLFQDCFAKGYVVTSAPDISINFQFERYCSLQSGLDKLCSLHNLRMTFQKKENKIEVSFEKKSYAGTDSELSKDSSIKIELKQNKNYPTALIALGKGELASRQVIYFQLQKNGEIAEALPNETWQDRIVATYENTSTEDLKKDALAKFKELTKGVQGTYDLITEVAVNATNLDYDIGDVIETFEPHTKTRIFVEIYNKICKKENEKPEEISYKVRGLIWE
ncbi:hypothetical protein HMPREF9089_00940 [Eubacterium brachy ATCC 33089]|nr:hypothetical protein HMPREF9089_00940 [Eubacterium brachy ATCC 33089]